MPILAADPAADFALPAPELRSLARRAVLPGFLGAAVLLAIIVGGQRIHQIGAVVDRVFAINGWWTLVGITCECVSIAGYVVLLATVAGRATPRIRLRESAEIALAGTAATRLLPTAGAGGAALTLWALRRAGLSAGAATRTLLSFLVLLYAVFLTAIVLAALPLALGLSSHPGPVVLSAIPAVGAALAIVVALGLAARPGRGRMTLLGHAIGDALGLVRTGEPRHLAAVVYWGLDATVLWAMLHAFGRAPSLPVVVLAYFVGQVANTLPLPGSVSGGIAGVLIAFGVPATVALPAVLAYRTIAVWLPVPFALAALSALRRTVSRWGEEDSARGREPAATQAGRSHRLAEDLRLERGELGQRLSIGRGAVAGRGNPVPVDLDAIVMVAIERHRQQVARVRPLIRPDLKMLSDRERRDLGSLDDELHRARLTHELGVDGRDTDDVSGSLDRIADRIEQAHAAPPRMRSSSARSSAVGDQRDAFAFARTCSGFVAPAITELTSARASRPPMATSSIDSPRSSP